MPAQKHTYAYGHVLRFGQTLLSSLIAVLVLNILWALTSQPFDLGIYLDLSLILTIILYVMSYHHTFNAGIRLNEHVLRIDRMVLDDHVLELADVRRIEITQHKPQLATLFAGNRLSMRVVGEANALTIEVSDLQDSRSFLDAMETIAQDRGIPVSYQNEKGEFLTEESDGQQISY
ncbi:hypothetical protein CLV84_2654 [Neolewinella xylanilytica]|uniref:DUF304 domain-containing protein n=1 Tax=Neolewinella xylanilytica TaxID=1514080 RepID=A0A2S6I3L4_9BACT|nr:hypothetical protein [Neolewinella xylanilytica]PPK85750.1 hypothetical protein CLV84_2654 [Neolewinella xylanilytica]